MVARETSESTSAENYSPSSPLDISFSCSDNDDFQVDYGSPTSMAKDPPHRPIILALPATPMRFGEKTRRKEKLSRALSVESTMRFLSNEDNTKMMCRKKRYEDWDAKGGFILRLDGVKDGTVAKSITDISMARDLGVEPGTTITSRLLKKRPAPTSPMDPTGTWSLKRS